MLSDDLLFRTREKDNYKDFPHDKTKLWSGWNTVMLNTLQIWKSPAPLRSLSILQTCRAAALCLEKPNMRRFSVVPVTKPHPTAVPWLLLDTVGSRNVSSLWEKGKREVPSSPSRPLHPDSVQVWKAGASISILVLVLTYMGISPNVCCLQSASYPETTTVCNTVLSRLMPTTPLCI